MSSVVEGLHLLGFGLAVGGGDAAPLPKSEQAFADAKLSGEAGRAIAFASIAYTFAVAG